MQEQQFDSQALMTRVTEVAKELRKSEAFPAIVGGIAGAIAGALIAAIIAGRKSTERDVVEETSGPKSKFNLSMKDAMQLATVLATLAKQVQAWRRSQDENEKPSRSQ